MLKENKYKRREYNWMCAEWEPTEEWKAEWERMHNE